MVPIRQHTRREKLPHHRQRLPEVDIRAVVRTARDFTIGFAPDETLGEELQEAALGHDFHVFELPRFALRELENHGAELHA